MRERHTGLELLRIVCMFMVVVLHVLGQGAVMVHVKGNGATYYTCYFLETVCLCAVNCYGLLSGYVGLHASFKPRRLLRMILTVEFYSILIALVLGVLHPDWIDRDTLFKIILPIQWKSYWYYSAYVALFFLMPFLNRGVRALTDQEKGNLLGTLFMVFCVFTMFAKVYSADFLSLVGGYSLVWLVVLYVFGAALRGLEEGRAQRGQTGRNLWDRILGLGKWPLLLIFLGSATLAWLWKLLVESGIIHAPQDTTLARMLLTYTSPTIFICGLCLLLIGRQIHIRPGRERNLIHRLAPAAFYVYIMHTHPLLWEHVLKNAFISWHSLPPYLVLLPVLGMALVIYLVCSGVEIARASLWGCIRRAGKGRKEKKKEEIAQESNAS